MSASSVHVGVQAVPAALSSWTSLARRVEALGFSALLAPDHPGGVLSPWITLAAAAAVTSRVALGSYMINAGVREPFHVAADAASLAIISGGRARLGIGAGHTPQEWAACGWERPGPAERVGRLGEFVDVVARLLRGEQVTYTGRYLRLRDAVLDSSLAPVTVPLTLGGASPALLRLAGAHADVVGLSGLGRTLPDGHHHQVRWSLSDVERQLSAVAEGAGAAGRRPVVEVLVHRVVVTDDRKGAAGVLAAQIPDLAAADALVTPYVLLGTQAEIRAQLEAHVYRWGITRWVIRHTDTAIGSLAPILPDLGVKVG
ncbi:LLM class flavin-dependent oxidoreductase [Protofrankia symbiont of Coriaria ruscifolia]|uniref:LLM class flavin-dependent oxidoreductase n=1 Tax=Protofrankia symbiont of Coriaria ruscifolia TaxID=1306542 RepID=UPI001A949556|nr:LLM class flavin-dependent oxidoreductase [Protofrankia symbiont of Coriaria ruscifolia]